MFQRLFALLCVVWLVMAVVACDATTAPDDAPATLPTASTTFEPSSTSTAVTNADHGDAAPVLTWHREGGIAGFCDELAMYDTGLVQSFSCKEANGEAPVWEAQLSTEALTELQRWQATYGSIDQTWSDEATADGMTEQISFVGQGGETADELTLQTMRDFAVKEFLTQMP
ncbi:MAG: hypothetical protein KDD73_09280 [Anaerolineales bacterium]|nr:hypothetical protein [Anaerolineales bacterium]MCB9127483.1 hypothetical protein [Ardenticatenales bacterium]